MTPMRHFTKLCRLVYILGGVYLRSNLSRHCGAYCASSTLYMCRQKSASDFPGCKDCFTLRYTCIFVPQLMAGSFQLFDPSSASDPFTADSMSAFSQALLHRFRYAYETPTWLAKFSAVTSQTEPDSLSSFAEECIFENSVRTLTSKLYMIRWKVNIEG